MMDTDIASHRQLLHLGLADHLYGTRGGNPAHVQPGARSPRELQEFAKRNRFGHGGDARQAQPGGYVAVVRDAVPCQRKVLGPQPYGEPERAGVLQGAPEHLRIVERNVGLRKGHASGLGQFGHFSQAFAGKLHGESADRVEARVGERPRAPAQHVHQPRLVQRRIGVGRAGDAGDAARDGSLHLGFERGLVFEPRFAQPRADVDQPGCDDKAFCLDHLVGACVLRGSVERGDALTVDQNVPD